MPFFTLTKYTVRAYFKERILLVVLFFALMLLISSYVLSPLAVGAQKKIVIDIGLAAISILGVMLIVLLGASSFHQEKEHGILRGLLAKPITRTDFILGKYAGTVLTVTAVLLVMAAVYFAVMKISGAPITENILWAIYFGILEVAVVTAVLTLFASFSSPMLSSFFTLCTVAAGHLSSDLLEFAERFGGVAVRLVAKVFYYALPNLAFLNIRAEAVHGLPLPEGYVYSVSIYSLFYAGVALVLSTLIFRRREV